MNMNIIIIIILIILCIIITTYNIIDKFINKWEDTIDGIVYINLDNREDRKNLLLKELEKINIDMDKVNKVSGSYIPNNGHKGCVQSHIIALTMAKLNRWNNVLIFEDDMELDVSPDVFNSNINNMLEYLNKNNISWDVIMLGVCHTDDPTWKKDLNNNLVKITKATCGH